MYWERDNQRAVVRTNAGGNLDRGKTLTRLAALATLSRGAGEGLQEIDTGVLLPRKRRDGRAEPQAGWKTSVRTSMLSRGRASGGVVGSVNEVCGMKRAGMSVRVSAIFNSSASSRLISGT